MAMTFTSAPEDATQVAVRGLASLRRAQGTIQTGEEGGGSQRVKASLPVYHVGPDGLSARPSTPAASARRIGWRYLVGEGDASRAVEVIGKEVSSIAQGSVVNNLARALLVASNSIDASRRYEARVLVFGRAGNSLLWLHTDDGADRFFSLEAQPREVDEGSAMRDASHKTALRQSMKAFKAAPDRLRAEDDESGG